MPTPKKSSTKKPVAKVVAEAPKTVSSTKAKSSATQVIAQLDVGFGNRLTIRGEGAGLSWENGQEMQWTDGSWSWQSRSKESIECKILLNDQVWAQGDNLQIKAGQQVVITPSF